MEQLMQVELGLMQQMDLEMEEKEVEQETQFGQEL
ncbi:hypothetical protein LCGC14_2623230 [marine sediment metagenome]|uniref:Uncharacterized protein n=1 Tax=marine sediment metagenome TaxID=412755 RepID=A0A0F9CDJ5_9ZZZZ